MTKVYKSKLGLELIIPMALIFGTALFITVLTEPSWLGLIILLPIITLITYMFQTTQYAIEGNVLKIKCGFLYNKQIEINTIRKISETKNLLSSPATSVDRLEILYNKNDSVFISPKLKKEFISSIRELNPEIEINLRVKLNK